MTDMDRLREARDVMAARWRHAAIWSVDEARGEVIGKGADRTWTAALRPVDGAWSCVMRSGYFMWTRTTTTAASPWRAFDLASHFQTFLERRTQEEETLIDECLCGDPRCARTPRS